jgi:hypothetical protein
VAQIGLTIEVQAINPHVASGHRAEAAHLKRVVQANGL